MWRYPAILSMFGLVLALTCPVRANNLPDGLYAAFSTSMGDFTCRLDYTGTPRTVANLVGLVEGTREWLEINRGRVVTDPFYAGVSFHRVITNFMIQAGLPAPSGVAVVGFRFNDEFATATSNQVDRGVLAMANAGPNSNTTQFFIPVSRQSHLDGVHTIFGWVVEGMDVVDAINLVPTVGSVPVTPVVINSVTIIRVGTDAQNWDPGTVDPPLPVPLVLATSITNDAGVLHVAWPYEPGTGHYIFFTTDLTADPPVNGQDVSAFSSVNLTGYQDTFPVSFFWTVREGRDPAP